MRKVLLAAGMMIISHSLMAQLFTGVDATKFHPSAQLVRMDERSNAPLFISFTEGSYIPASSGMESLRAILKSKNDDSWQLIRTDADDIGMNHQRYQQYYRGVPVVTGEYIIHEKNGKMVSANGVFYDGLNLSASPQINESIALQNALNDIGASTYLWQTSDREQEALVGHSHGRSLPQGELVILPSLTNDKHQSVSLCWKFDIYATQPHERFHIYINAVDGRVMFKENRICTFVANGSGNTKYSGTQSFTTDSLAPGSYRLRDISRGSGIETYDLNNGTNYGAAVDFTDTDNVWTVTTNQDDAALDAHWGTQKTYDYYLQTHSRNSYNNAGAILRSYVHYSSGYNNAFWNGSQMTYGDGNGSTFSPLTELDVVAHELTHGVTEYSSNLVYSYQSGALNESFSDIFGTTVDFFARPLTANWKIGDQCYTPGTAGDALRFMDNPNAAGDPDTYLGTYWYTGTGDAGGVHTNSGVQNFWYYLLSVGGTGTNDVGFAYNVSGITIAKARMIAYRNNSFYLTSGSQYSDAGFYSLQSASDLYGNCSAEAVSVKNAWDAVNVTGLQLNANATVTANPACTGGVIQLNAAGGTSYVWSGPGGFSSTSASPSISNASSANNGVYTCTVTNANGCSSSKSVTISVLPAPSVSVTGGGAICGGTSLNLACNAAVAGTGNSSGSNNALFNIPDANQTGISSTIPIGRSLNASSIISVTIDSIIHPYTADLVINLVAPNGSTITLASGVGGA
ncbi:MAG TPA: M4 family metallopeptidase, partial [Bacteroidia bacterium]|nr:M4 family metallopeptidase [Bacteroidia bacterium]